MSRNRLASSVMILAAISGWVLSSAWKSHWVMTRQVVSPMDITSAVRGVLIGSDHQGPRASQAIGSAALWVMGGAGGHLDVTHRDRAIVHGNEPLGRR